MNTSKMTISKTLFFILCTILTLCLLISCNDTEKTKTTESSPGEKKDSGSKKEYLSQPLVKHIYTADPSAHFFNGRLYIYPSHDTATGTAEDDLGSHFDMRDYHILSMDSIGAPVTDHGVALDIKDVPWAGRQLWAPDAAFANNTYYLYFPAKNKQDVFQIGVATTNKPEGPFVAEKEPISGSYSIDPSVFKDEDGSFYMYFGGIWGGQLQRWKNNRYDSASGNRKPGEMAILPRVAKMGTNMKTFSGPVKEVQILDKTGKPFSEKDNDKRFFEGSWVFKKDDKYYFTYSTGDTHNLVYATGTSPYGPFTYQGIFLNPVEGWTSHHSIIQAGDKWWLFYHDTQLSGKTHLRNVKVAELKFNPDGSIQTLNARK
jgi:predicted small secreted protein